ncbi:MAG: MMPL family transporter [Pseudomonadota bacterium]
MGNWLTHWVRWVAQHAFLCFSLILSVTLILGWVAYSQFRLNSNLSDLIAQDAPWRADFDRFETAFPDLLRTAVVVLSSESLSDLEAATGSIVQKLASQPDLYRAVAAPGSEAFFRDHAFLYMDVDDLDDMADRLAEAQPWLSVVREDPSLNSIVELLEDGFVNEPPEGFVDVLDLVLGSAENHLSGQDGAIKWADEFFPLDEARYQLIYLKPQVVDQADGSQTKLTDAQMVAALRASLAEVNLPDSVTVKLTGEIPLQHEEIEAAVTGISLAGWLSLGLLLIVLVVGVRSGKIVLATFSMLAIGVIWTSAYAMLTVGEFNTISLVFIVMFFGLGVDFALHFSLRFQEAINDDDSHPVEALVVSTASVGRAISLCTVTTALGFLVFWPTDYQGLADLGVISAGGMAVAWILTFTYLPAVYSLLGPPRAHKMDLPTSDAVVHWLIGHRPWVLGVVAVSSVLAIGVASRSSFDYSVLALKDEASESMSTLRELQAEGLSTDYQLFYLSDAPLIAEEVESLATVDELRRPLDFVPQDQEDKLYVIEDLQFLLSDALAEDDGAGQAASIAQSRQTIKALSEMLDSRVHTSEFVSSDVVDQTAQTLAQLAQLSDEQLGAWQTSVVSQLVAEIAWLQRALTVTELNFDDLPDSVTSRLVGREGERLNSILPKQDIAQVDALSDFITEVRGVLPGATGRPVIEWGVGQIVVDAFIQALTFAFIVIGLVILVSLRSVQSTAMIMLPLGLTAVCALAVGVLIEQPINMASILVLPLIFGLGVDNGIHVVDRYLGEGDVEHLMHSSTPRAVMLSTLTTIGAFAALSISPHMGTASIGVLLSVSVGFLLLFTIFLVPVLLARAS